MKVKVMKTGEYTLFRCDDKVCKRKVNVNDVQTLAYDHTVQVAVLWAFGRCHCRLGLCYLEKQGDELSLIIPDERITPEASKYMKDAHIVMSEYTEKFNRVILSEITFDAGIRGVEEYDPYKNIQEL